MTANDLRSKVLNPPMLVMGALVLLVMALIPALGTVPAAKAPLSTPTSLGYTWSLLLFVLPLLAIAGTRTIRAGPATAIQALWITIAIFAPIGFLLDIFLGLLFFEFPNTEATLGIYLPAYDWASGSWVLKIPVEEFVFYGAGIAFVAAFYIWLDEGFLKLYQHRVGGNEDRVGIYWPAFGLAALLIVGAIAIRKFGPGAATPGFPGWFIFLIVVAVVPAALFYRTVQHRVNWRAFAFTVLTMLLISVMWEVTLALPYQWWAFREEQMLGIYINAWSALPVEEPFLWVLVSYTTIISYEAVRKKLEQGPKDRA